MDNILTAPKDFVAKMDVPGFSSYMARLTNSKVTGVFLEMHKGQLVRVMKSINKISKEKNSSATSSCKNNCQNRDHAGGTCQHLVSDLNKGIAAGDIITESRFTDLLIIDADMTFDEKQGGIPSALTKAVLTKSECPVIIAPYAFNSIDEIIFAYDGSPSAVFAIKQFTYLFPALMDKKLTILQVNSQGNEEVHERERLLKLLQSRYAGIGFQVLTGNASDQLYQYLAGRENALVVMGAFGSQHISLPFRNSTAEPLVKTINLPLFIAHH